MRISAIIVTYNKLDYLKESIDSLLSILSKEDNLIVVNNNSSDGTKEYLDGLEDGRVIVQNISKNIGGAGGFHKGLKIAYENTQSDYFWIMDDDAIAEEDSLKELIESAQNINNQFGFLSSNVTYENGDGTNCPKTTYGNWNLELKRNGLISISEGSFVSLFLKRETVKKVGLPLKEMFIWGDDIEYTTRISKSFIDKSYFVSTSNVTHFSKNVDTNIYTCPVNLFQRYEFMFRNFIYTDLHNISKQQFLYDFLRNFIACFKVLFKSKDHKAKRIMILLRGTIKGLLFNPSIEFPKDNDDNTI